MTENKSLFTFNNNITGSLKVGKLRLLPKMLVWPPSNRCLSKCTEQ